MMKMKKALLSSLMGLAILLILCSCGETQKRKLIGDLNHASKLRRAAQSRLTMEVDRGDAREPEFRAAWMSVYTIKSPEDIRKAVKNLADYNFNAIMFHVRDHGTCFYDSSLEPWALELGGGNPGWDPLGLAIEEAHKSGLQIHAWVNMMPGWTGEDPPKDPRHLWNKNPRWFMIPYSRKGKGPSLEKEFTFLSPCLEETRSYLANLCLDLAEKYPVDGIHFDYIRFPGPDYSYDEKSLSAFKSEYKKDLNAAPELWSAFRRDSVTRLVSRCYAELRKKRPGIVVSAATWGNHREGFTNYYQDAHGWLARGILDISMPMIYRASEETFQNLALEHISNAHQRAMYPGIASYLIKEPQTLLSQVEICRSLNTRGMVFYDYSSLFPNHMPGALADALLQGPFSEPAPPPPLPWLEVKDDDQIGPLITNVRTEPEVLLSGQSFKVLCDIEDPSGVYDTDKGSYEQGIYLLYDVNPSLSNGREATLSLSTEKTYVTDHKLAAPARDQTLYIRIYAWDDDADAEEGGIRDRALGTSELVRLGVNTRVKGFRFSGNFSEPVCGLQYPDLDAQGRLWVCARNHNQALILNPDGTPFSLSPLRTGLNEKGETVPIDKPSGLAIDKKKNLAYISSGNLILRFHAQTGKPLPAIKTKSAVCNDIALDDSGNIYAVNGTRRRWMKFQPDGNPAFPSEISPFSENDRKYDNPCLTRGIAVTQDGGLVYVLCDDDQKLDVYHRDQTDSDTYHYQGALITVAPGSMAVDISPDGRIYVSDGDGSVKIFSSYGKRLGELRESESPPDLPGGVCFSPDSRILYIVQTGRFLFKAPIQKWIQE